LATALQMLLGGRARADAVRKDARKAIIEGTFFLPEGHAGRMLFETLGDLAEEVDAEDGIVLRRSLSREGRSRGYVDGVAVPVRALASLGERLVSYHGQREQARLTDPAEQLGILDDFLDGEAAGAKASLRELWGRVERERRELEELRGSAGVRLREVEFLRYQVSELEEASYSTEEITDLTRERDRLRNITDLLSASSAAVSALAGEEGGAVDSLARAESELNRAARYDDALSALLSRLGGLSAELEDVVYELRAYLDELEADPGRLEAVEERLQTLRALERKYGENVEEYLKDARERLSRLENFEEETAGLEERIRRGEAELEALGETLSAGRRRAAGTLSAKVQANLEDLNLGKTTFKVELVEGSLGLQGRERVEFVIHPNPGEPELPVRKYASGGELSRIMLAIRLAQERVEPGATYVFDEVDAGIGGETATAVGAKLKELGERNQVLTITHLPQIASEASSHVVVAKASNAGRTLTRIRTVKGEERRRELARMLSGRVDEASLVHARQLLISEH
ncbi:MAG TPA: DNA repair protein RecN, partial [Rubrobacteraceae bacterium]|nr:DNA repair protein RecN [Rubrobacteraceae bacterium]